MDTNAKIALGLIVAGTLYSQHQDIKKLRKAHNLMSDAVRAHILAHRQAEIDAKFKYIVQNYDRW